MPPARSLCTSRAVLLIDLSLNAAIMTPWQTGIVTLHDATCDINSNSRQ